MFPIDTSLLASILASVIIVFSLILVKIRQEKTDRRPRTPSNLPTVTREGRSLTEEAQTKQYKCSQYFGYLYNNARSQSPYEENPEDSPYPDECYECPLLIDCLHSPTIIQRIYGNENDEI